MQKEDYRLAINDFKIQIRELNALNSKEIPIFLLHDSLGCITTWKDFPNKLAKITGSRVIIYDRKGYGKSTPYTSDYSRNTDYMEDEADVLLQIADQLSIPFFTLIGHSDGATIALIAASKYPNRINKTVVIGPHIYVEDITLKGIRDAKNAYESTDLKQKLEKHHGANTSNLVRVWLDIWLSQRFRNWNIKEQIKSITHPVLCIQGDKDEYGTEQQVRDIQDHIDAACQVVILPNLGHTPYKENPTVVIKLLTSFLGS